MTGHPFDQLMQLETAQIRLDCAALHIARDVYPGLNLCRYLGALDRMADEVGSLRPGLAANLRYEAMHEVLVESHSLTGTARDPFDPENSYLNRVLDAGVGLPISLSVVWIEVARRLKWPVSGVALPGSFLVRFDDSERFVLANPYHDGCSLTLDDCQLLVKEKTAGRVAFTTAHLKPLDTRAVLSRLLRNLVTAYLRRGDLRRLAATFQRLCAIRPRSGRYLQDLAAVRYRLGDLRGSAACLKWYLSCRPEAPDAHIVRQNLRQLEAAVLTVN